MTVREAEQSTEYAHVIRFPGPLMVKIIGMIGSFLGGSIGWWIGARVGIMTAFMVSMVGTGIGIYYGRQIAIKLDL